MSILSDTTLCSLCELPETFFDERQYHKLVSQRATWPLARHAVENIKADMRQQATRAYTQEERDAFTPMIAPFHPQLIRQLEGSLVPYGDCQISSVGPDGEVHSEQAMLRVGARKIISKGLTSYGYDVSLQEDECWVFTNIHSGTIDPKRFDPEKCLTRMTVHTDHEDGAKYVIMPPNSYMLARTVEYFHIPRDIMVICLGKSTYARCGAIVNTTPIEPGFEGNVVIEIGNATNSPMRIYLDEGIAQFLFFRGDQPCGVSYGDRGGKYQGQTGVQLPKV
ncbi:deoxycytidine triphosphate deaminase [Xanthomonas phage vB_XciM_LucasX]|nr:deoxycytidine triphosphate deaminase [Xanthomonas phage vB_XciM_LucasX]